MLLGRDLSQSGYLLPESSLSLKERSYRYSCCFGKSEMKYCARRLTSPFLAVWSPCSLVPISTAKSSVPACPPSLVVTSRAFVGPLSSIGIGGLANDGNLESSKTSRRTPANYAIPPKCTLSETDFQHRQCW